MFQPVNRNDKSETNVGRRVFLAGIGAALGGALLWKWRKPYVIAVEAKAEPGEVTIVQFSDDGKRLGKVKIAKVVKSEEEWRRQLSPGAFEITRHADTEIAYTGKYWNLHDTGIYRCICCDNALFSSSTKFESGTGWPSFWAPIAEENVREIRDNSIGMERTAIACTECDAHLGHVFEDGPQPTGLRYCMNSASLRFVKAV
ncbi:MAG: peptide-methionine (R)-S-oxide reductase MsrB [Candidatus Sulfotelmatobacter sp.]